MRSRPAQISRDTRRRRAAGAPSQIAVIDGQGELSLSRRIVNDREPFLALLAGREGESRIAVEATYGWAWLAELLEDAGYVIHLAHPLRTRAIAAARVKTDAVDAKTLAHSAAAARSPSSRSHARSSPSAPTACATERSVARPAAAGRARRRNRRSHQDRPRTLPTSVGLAPPAAARCERSGELAVSHRLTNPARPPT